MILQRYIGMSMLKGWLLVMVVLGAVFGLIAFTEELERVSGNYNAIAAARFTLLNLPDQLVSLAPVIAILGSIVALANLDRHNELTIISCTGFSPGKLLGAIALPTILFMAVLWLLMEYVTPQLEQTALSEKNRLRYDIEERIPGGGLWSTNGRRYINLRALSRDLVAGDIELYEFDEQGQLSRAIRADSAEVSNDRRWTFRGVREKALEDGTLVTRQHDSLEVANLWSRNELPTLSIQGESMSLSVLYRYAHYRAGNNQPWEKHLNTFWQRALMPLTVAAMVLLATPISASVTAGRDRSFGLNLGIGAIVGIVFYLGAQIIFALGQLLGWSIPLVAVLPALIIFLCALVMLRRMRW